MLWLQQCRIQAASATYTTDHGNTRSLTDGVRPGTKPTSSWFLDRFDITVPQQELLSLIIFLIIRKPNRVVTIRECSHLPFNLHEFYYICVWEERREEGRERD